MTSSDPSRGFDLSPVEGSRGGPDAAAPQPPLLVTVYHGDLRYVGLPVIVGSNDGTPIRGAERAVDEFLGGAVRRRAALRRLHGAAGTCELFSARETKDPAALVVGLGNPGDLTPAALADLTTQAVLRFAAERLDQLLPGDKDEHREAVAAVLIGTTGQAPLTVASSLAALVTGTRRANRVLADQDHRLTVGELRVVELYEERAIEAQHAAGRLTREPGRDSEGLQVGEYVLDGYGGITGLPLPSYEEGAWRTVRIVGLQPSAGADPDSVELSFTSVGRAARAEQQVTLAQRRLVEQLVAETVCSPRIDAQLCNTLYELLVPNAMKGQSRASENLMCVVDEYSAALPLEMLATRTDGDDIVPLVVEAGVVRRLETRSYRERVQAATGNRALVIADPPGTGLPPLPGAREEARRVADALEKHQYQVERIIPDDGDVAAGRQQLARILNALFAHEYRIVHIAGHGRHDPGSSASSGVVIGDGQVLSALEVEKMSATPDLFFLNCCSLASVETSTPRPDRLAATIARQLIDIGVRAVVAAGWAVNDQAATLFAETFYTQLLADPDGGASRDLGTAARAARTAVRRKPEFQNLNTWGAYQVYGPPSFRLVSFRSRTTDRSVPIAPREFRDALDRIARRADDARQETAKILATELTDLLAQVPQDWVDRELDRVGAIWTAFGDYEQALTVLGRARESWTGKTSLRSMEQLVNVEVKRASELLAADPTDERARSLLTDARKNLRALLQVHDTPERRCLLGSLERRRAQFPALGPVRAALERARKQYRWAEELQSRRGVVDPYASLNRIAVRWLLSFHGAPAPDREEAERTIGSCRAVPDSPCPDFWALVTPADCVLTEALVDDELTSDSTRALIAQLYAEVFTVRSTRRERLTVVEHLEVLERCLPSGDTDDRAAAAAKALADLRERVLVLV